MSAKRMIQICLLLLILFGSFAFTSNTSASGYCSSTYVVQPGDWLTKIARRCGVTLSALYAANPYVGYYIYPGQVLNIPGGYTPSRSTYFCGPAYRISELDRRRICLCCRGIFQLDGKKNRVASRRDPGSWNHQYYTLSCYAVLS